MCIGLFPSSVNIFFIIDALNSLSCKLLISLSLCSFQGLLLLFQLRAVSLYFHFALLFLLLWEKLLPIVVLQGDLRGNITVRANDAQCLRVGELGLPWRQIMSFLRLAAGS